jgi:DegV family protein with EDD domain
MVYARMLNPTEGYALTTVDDGIALLTDSSASIPQTDLRRFDIHSVPITIQVGSEEFRDGIDLDAPRLYRALQTGVPVKSAAPSPLDYLDAFESCGERPVVVVTPASEFTRMHRNATLAAELSGRPVSVIDSRTAAAAQGLVVLAAAEARAEGRDVGEVVAAANAVGARAELVACLENLDTLRASGRVPAVALGLAGRLGVRPVFRLRAGVVERMGLPRSEEAALLRVARHWQAEGGPATGRTVVFHAARWERAESLRRLLAGPSIVVEFSAAMGIHTGPGVVGAAWLRPAIGDA